MESKLMKIFVSLGVPGLALGIFYMLFRKFSWEFPIVPSTWVGPIIVLFMLLTSGLIFYALTLWKPRSRLAFTPANGNDPAHSGAIALHEVLQFLRGHLDRESDKLANKNSETNSLTKQKNLINAAKIAVERATNHTRHYIADRRIGQRDRNIERELSDEWIEVGNYLRDIDSPEAKMLYEICFIKARYWSDTDGWDDSYAGGKDISLDYVLNMVQQITTSGHAG